ncbi:MAG: sensor histidine kinase [Thermoleophilia bacterium]
MIASAQAAPGGSPIVARPPSGALLWAIGLAGVAASAAAATVAMTTGRTTEPEWQAVLFAWIVLTYTVGGAIAWWRRPDSRFGPLMVAAGAAMFVSSLYFADAAALFTLGQAFDLIPAALFLHVYLAYPSGRLGGVVPRGIVVVAYACAVGLQVVNMTLGNYGPDNLLEVTQDPDAGLIVTRIQLTTLSACMLAGVAVLVVRRRREGRPGRLWVALLIDSFALALVMIAFLFTNGAWGKVAFPWVQRATLFVIGLAPVAFLLGLFQARLARASVGDLLVGLRAEPSPRELRDALAAALRDPSLELAYWLPEFDCYADLDGRVAEVPRPGSGRAVTVIDRDGARVAALVHDPSLGDDAQLLAAVTAAAGIAIENTRLQVELRARLEELKGSRARVIEAGQSERQRLERNLHDGAQQRLIALSLELGMLEQRVAADPEAGASIERARREIATSLEELREISRGLHPAVVSGHGLAVALEQLAAGAAVPVQLDVELGGRRLPEPLEVAAYYLVSESLANVGKYARASSATVVVRRRDSEVTVEVVDDGVGGADTDRGSGLRGLADRVEALDGRLRVWSPRGGGTRVRAEFPCAS